MQLSQKNIRFLSKLFNIRANEWPRFIIIYVMYMMILIGIMWGEPIIQAAFLEQVGIDFLPLVFVANAIISIIASAIYTGFADKIDNTTLLISILGIGMFFIAIGLIMLDSGLTIIAYPVLLMALSVPLTTVYNVHWSMYVNSFYNTQSAKRIIPILASSARISGIIAGVTLPILNNYLSPFGIISLWLITLITAVLLSWLMPYILGENKIANTQAQQQSQTITSTRKKISYIDNVKEGFHYVYQSPFLLWMSIATLFTFILLPLIDFQALKIMEIELKTTKDISNFIAMLNTIGNLIALPIQLFVMNRLIGQAGLGNTSMIFPTGLVAASGALLFVQNIYTAATGYVSRTTFRTTFRNPVDNLLYNAVPLRVKGRARAFIVGLVVPVGLLIGGLILLIPAVSETNLLPILIGVLSIAYLASSFVVRKQYGQALLTMLEQEDFSFLFSRGESTDLIATDPATLSFLQKKLEQSSNPESTILMAQLICQADGKQAIPILEPIIRTSTDKQLQVALLNIIIAANVQSNIAQRLYTDFLKDSDAYLRQVAVVGLEQLLGADDEQFISLVSEMLSDPEIDVTVQVLSSIAHSNKFFSLAIFVEKLDQLLTDTNPKIRVYAIQVLGQIGNEQAIHKLLKHLDDSEDEVRMKAAMSIENSLDNKLSDTLKALIAKRMSRLLKDRVERVRQATLNILGPLGNNEIYQDMVISLSDSSFQVRRTAVDVLASVGKSVIPLLHPQFDSPNSQLRKMTAVILCRINKNEFGPLVNTHITGNLLIIYRNQGNIKALSAYEQHTTIFILQSAIREQNQELLDEIFYLMSAIHNPEAIKIIAESLQNESKLVRANAIEALESLTSPQTVQLIAPLFESDTKIDHLLEISQNVWDMQHHSMIAVVKQLLNTPDNSQFRAIMTFALAELGETPPADKTKLLPDTPPPPASKTRKRNRRRQPKDLFSALTGATEKNKTPPVENKREKVKPVLSTSNNEQLFTQAEIREMLDKSFDDPAIDVQLAARAASQKLNGFNIHNATLEEIILLSPIEKIIFLNKVPFFKGMTVNQLSILANICEEQFFEEDTKIFKETDPGGILYVVVSGRVGIEQEKRKGFSVRLSTLEAYSYFGEISLFDNTPRSSTAIAIKDTLTLRLRREPLIALSRQYPDLSMELIRVLSERLRAANDRIAELTRVRSRKVQKLFDKFD